MARRVSFLVAAAIVLGSLPALAQRPALDPLQQAIASVKRLLDKRPDDPTVHFYLASFQAQAGERDNALASLRKVLELGDGFLPGNHFGFDKLQDDPDFRSLRADFDIRLIKSERAPTAFILDDKTFSPEGIAYDARSDTFFMGSVTQKRIVRITRAGKVTPFSLPGAGLQHVLGLAVDGKRRTLYAVSTNALSNGKPLHNSVVAFDIRSGKRLREYSVPDAAQLNDVVIGPGGDLFTTDSRAGAVWRISTGRAPPVTSVVAAGALGGSNGIALSADSTALYVGHSTGVARVELASGKLERMAIPARQTVAGIDGLYQWQGDLIGIQNLTNPGRMIRMTLNAAGTAITAVETLQSHHNPAFSEPTTGAIAGKHIYAIGKTDLPRYDEQGKLEGPVGLNWPVVVRVPLDKG
jgi:hypothetical protein